MTDKNKHPLKKAENCCTSGYQNPLLQTEDEYQRCLNTQEEYLDLYSYENIYKDYNEMVHKLDMYISKSQTENELQEHCPTFISFQCLGKDIIRWGKAKKFLGGEISREKSFILQIFI